MKPSLITLILAVGMLMATASHAQQKLQSAGGQIGAAATPATSATETVPASPSIPPVMLEQYASPWKAWLGTSSANMTGLAIAIGVLFLIAVAFILRKHRAAAGAHEPPVYEAGYDTIDPNGQGRREPGIREPGIKPASPGLAARSRTDTVIAPWSVPANFDVPRFLRKSKAYFMRLQAAWDNGDLRDIRMLTTRELFGEFCKQLGQRGTAPNVTEVVTLGAELVKVDTGDNDYRATVKFTGMIKEAPDAAAMPFSEIWNMSKPVDGTRSWAIAGIEQH